FSSQVVQPPIDGQAHQHGVELALMVRQYQHTTLGRHILAAGAAHAIQRNAQKPTRNSQVFVPEPSCQRAISHRWWWMGDPPVVFLVNEDSGRDIRLL